MEQHVEKHKCAPVVIPVLFYHGAMRLISVSAELGGLSG
ncbi:Rpn family recombination-promoting nuclease/putative transposase [Escherichia coli]|nr:Rpn family recombination-promoting nuclease/putative transposase [Escherichia coli]